MTNGLSDVDVLALTLYGEARGEPVEGRIAVACVIRNRVNADLGNDGKPDWWGEGYAGVCLKPSQFSCWNDRDKNRPLLDTLAAKCAAGSPILDPGFQECRWIAAGVIDGLVLPRVGRATHYYADYLQPPAWAAKATLVARVRSHLFFEGVS